MHGTTTPAGLQNISHQQHTQRHAWAQGLREGAGHQTLVENIKFGSGGSWGCISAWGRGLGCPSGLRHPLYHLMPDWGSFGGLGELWDSWGGCKPPVLNRP